MYYGGMNSLNELAALSDGEAALAGLGQMAPWWQTTLDAAAAAKKAQAAKPSPWTPELVGAIGGTLQQTIRDVGALNVQRIYAKKGIMIPTELAPPPPPVRVTTPWPAWSKWLIVGGAVLLAGSLVYKATKK
jgi:hypothetical protein